MQKQSKNYNDFYPFEFEYGLIYARLTIDEVAKLAHVHPKTAAKWATGSQKPHPSTWELVRLKATRRILPDTRPWLAVYVSESGKLAMADGREFFAQEIYLTDLQQGIIKDTQRDLKNALAKQTAMIMATQISF